MIRTAAVSPEEVGFPFASQAARLLRQTKGRKDEEVALEWSSHQRRPYHVTTTTFQTLMAENHRALAVRFVRSKRLSLKNLS